MEEATAEEVGLISHILQRSLTTTKSHLIAKEKLEGISLEAARDCLMVAKDLHIMLENQEEVTTEEVNTTFGIHHHRIIIRDMSQEEDINLIPCANRLLEIRSCPEKGMTK